MSKWKDEEVRQMLEYLEKHPKEIDENRMSTITSIRSMLRTKSVIQINTKLGNLKQKYRQYYEDLESAGFYNPTTTLEGKEMKEYILSKFPFYDELHSAFGEKTTGQILAPPSPTGSSELQLFEQGQQKSDLVSPNQVSEGELDGKMKNIKKRKRLSDSLTRIQIRKDALSAKREYIKSMYELKTEELKLREQEIELEEELDEYNSE